MRSVVYVFLLITVVMGMGGCVLAIGNKGIGDDDKAVKSKQSCESTGVFAEIDAAGDISVESSRLAIYRAIAQRSGLSANERAHLITAVQENITIEADRAEVLLTLAKNDPHAKPEAAVPVAD
ncbi:hypothetical protein ACFL6U_11835 [Planctomycetota bacterium]